MTSKSFPRTREGRRAPGPRSGLAARVRRALGLRESVTFDGARYRECTTEPLRHALSKRGAGFKEYDVTFRGGSKLRIRCTRERVFCDLVPPPSLPVLLRAERLLRPGMRALVMPCGTGFSAAVIAGRVAPSGAVVAIDSDEQSVEFATLRYPVQNVSFEWGGMGELRGETDGSFDAAIVITPNADPPDEPDLAELWRVVAPGGWLFIAHVAGEGNDRRDPSARLLELLGRVCRDESADHPSSTSHIGPLGDGRDGWVAAVAQRVTAE